MNLRHFAAMSLSMLILAAASLPIPASADTQCGDHTDNRSADCIFECGEGNTLYVKVTADDEDANAIGSANCGGTSASCRKAISCDDTSDDGAQRDDAEGKCHGETEEAWASGFQYECKAIAVSGPGDFLDPDRICEYVPQVCDAKALAEWAQGVGTGLAEYLQENGAGFAEDCVPSIRITKMEGPKNPKQTVEEEVGRYHDFASECAAASGADPATGLAFGVVSQVHVTVKGTLALGEVCKAGVGCWYVLPACERNAEGLIRACTVDGGSPRVEPAENLKAALGF